MDEILKLWPFIIFLVGFIVWFVRLEGRVNNIEKTQTTEISRISGTMEKLDGNIDEIKKALGELSVSVASLVGYQKGESATRRRAARD